MERLSYSCRCALVVKLANKLSAQGSWCGETHLQKAIYILQNLSTSNFGYKFVLYKHGPYSFELNSELTSMRAANILDLRFLKQGYGPTIAPTSFGERIYQSHIDNISNYELLLNFVARWFSDKDVRYLEKIATAYYVTTKNPRDPALERAKRLVSLKPHVGIQDAEEAIRIVDEKRIQAAEQIESIAEV